MAIGDIVPRVTIIKEVPSGNIRLESGSDGLYILFDCECNDALELCKAHCCSCNGIAVFPEETAYRKGYTVLNESTDSYEMKKDSDGACHCLSRETRTCNIYPIRPDTCKEFHCTRGSGMRGFKVSNAVIRQGLLDEI